MGDVWWQVIAKYLQTDATVLDIGCGCGRSARSLLPQRSVRRYVGFDVMRASDLRFPCEDREADIVIAASVFTHLLQPDAVHYLKEIGRVLSRRGRAILSIHNNVSASMRFAGTETRIDIEPAYFIELAANAGLSVVDGIDDLCGQQVIVFSRRQEGSTTA